MITPEQRNVDFLKDVVRQIWKVIKAAETYAQELFPQLTPGKCPNLPEELTAIHAEDILAEHPDRPRKQREGDGPSSITTFLGPTGPPGGVWTTWAASTTRLPSNEPSSDNSPDGTSWELTHNS